MKVFVVHGHPEPGSFCGAMARAAEGALREAGHEVVVSDLYAMDFEARVGPADLADPQRRGPVRVSEAQAAATAAGRLPPDVRAEQEKLRWCDLLVLQFPLWWCSAPAIVKGWFDRVLTPGFAWGPEQRFASGGLRGRCAMLVLATGAPQAAYGEDGSHGPLEAVLHPIHRGVLEYVGFEVLPPFVAWAPGHAAPADRRATLDRLAARMRAVEPPRTIAYPRRRSPLPQALGAAVVGAETGAPGQAPEGGAA